MNQKTDYNSMKDLYNASMGAQIGVDPQIFDNLIWLTAKEAAIYLRRLDEDGNPSVKSIYHAIYRRKIKAKKFLRKWLIKKSDLDKSIETSKL